MCLHKEVSQIEGLLGECESLIKLMDVLVALRACKYWYFSINCWFCMILIQYKYKVYFTL